MSLGLSVASQAIIPDPATSTTPACLRMSPGGGAAPTSPFRLNVTVIGTNGLPIPNTEVRLIIASPTCDAGLFVCPGETYPVVTGMTDGSGQVNMAANFGGCCVGTAVGVIEADPGAVVLRTYNSIGTTDPTRNGAVQLGDFVAFQTAFLSSNPCFDYAGCNDLVQLGDFVAFQNDFLKACP
jgi:hypothetical protein